MLAQGNGEAAVCAANLLRTVRGEVPMSRVKGIGREHFDGPAASRAPELAEDASWLLGIFEPRLESRDVEVLATGVDGDHELEALAEL